MSWNLMGAPLQSLDLLKGIFIEATGMTFEQQHLKYSFGAQKR